MAKLSKAELRTLEAKAQAGTLNDFEKIKLTAHFTAESMQDNNEKKPLALMTFAIGSLHAVKDLATGTYESIKERGELARLERKEKSRNDLNKELACLKIDYEAGTITKAEYDKECKEIQEILDDMED